MLRIDKWVLSVVDTEYNRNDIILTALNNKRRGVSMQEKVKLNNGLSKFKESLNKNALIRLGFYIFTLIAIVLKGALFLGFSLNQNLYTLNFGLGYRQASYFINYYKKV